jgi:hypothetical protein
MSRAHPTQRAPDWWESARFQAFRVASSWFRQSGVVSSRPPVPRRGITQTVIPLSNFKQIRLLLAFFRPTER